MNNEMEDLRQKAEEPADDVAVGLFDEYVRSCIGGEKGEGKGGAKAPGGGESPPPPECQSTSGPTSADSGSPGRGSDYRPEEKPGQRPAEPTDLAGAGRLHTASAQEFLNTNLPEISISQNEAKAQNTDLEAAMPELSPEQQQKIKELLESLDTESIKKIIDSADKPGSKELEITDFSKDLLPDREKDFESTVSGLKEIVAAIEDLQNPDKVAKRLEETGKIDDQAALAMKLAVALGKGDEFAAKINENLEKNGAKHHVELKHSSHDWHDPHKMRLLDHLPGRRDEPDGKVHSTDFELHSNRFYMQHCGYQLSFHAFNLFHPNDLDRYFQSSGKN